MSSSEDGYAVIRSSTLAWLLERARVEGELRNVPEEVARDLSEAVEHVAAPVPEGDRLRALGPVLAAEEHIELLERDADLELPRDKHGGAFWRLVVRIVLAIQANEAEAVLRLISDRSREHGKR
jgi:hypothetical protein